MIEFPATLIVSASENKNNAKIAKYFHNNYPDMIEGIRGQHTLINEEVYINGNTLVDGKVIGVAHWYSGSYPAVIFYTENGLNIGYGLRVFYEGHDGQLTAGYAGLWFYD